MRRPDDLELASSLLSLSSSSSSSYIQNNSSTSRAGNNSTVAYSTATPTSAAAMPTTNSNDSFRLSYLEERALVGNSRGSLYDDIDLASECSTPSIYTPGKYLQLCDIAPSEIPDVTLWPPLPEEESCSVRLDASAVDEYGNSRQKEISTVRSSYNFNTQSPLRRYSDRHQCRHTRCLSNKFVVLIAVCLIIALSALGGLAVVI